MVRVTSVTIFVLGLKKLVIEEVNKNEEMFLESLAEKIQIKLPVKGDEWYTGTLPLTVVPRTRLCANGSVQSS